jgi:hypothetical protein
MVVLCVWAGLWFLCAMCFGELFTCLKISKHCQKSKNTSILKQVIKLYTLNVNETLYKP